jgi:glycosyltransferase involved in cell wall biosynthesis
MVSENKFDNTYIICNPSQQNFQGDQINLQNLPKVSFCIPTFNSEETIERCLSSIISQNYPYLEIIIVDGYSTDNTVNIVKKFTDKIFFEKGLVGFARQKSIQEADGEIVAVFDSDIIIPHENWLRNAVKYFNYRNNVSTVWPLLVAPPNASKIAKLYQTNLHKILIYNRMKNNKGLFGGGTSLIVRKYLIEIGGINTSLHWGEDFDWAKKLKDNGYSVVFISDPIYHDTMRTLQQFYTKQFAGAKTFTQTGFGIMGLSIKDIFYEIFFLGCKGMVHGLIIERDTSWLYYPVFVFIRILAYSSLFIKNTLSRQSGA